MAVLDFLRRNHRVRVAMFHHGTPDSESGLQVVRDYCQAHDLHLEVGRLLGERPRGSSMEEFYRDQRYRFLDALPAPDPVILAHHLDDCAETWIWSMCHGQPRLMEARRGRCIRPFLGNHKIDFESWARRHRVPWHEDASNLDTKFIRNHIRHCVMPQVLAVNPGIHKMLKKKLVDRAKNTV